MANQKPGPRYRADIRAGSLKVTESRRIADLLLHNVDADDWTDAIVKHNILQARTPATARRLARLIRSRLESMGPDLWRLVRDGKGSVATHAVFAAAVKQSPLLGDFLEMVVADHVADAQALYLWLSQSGPKAVAARSALHRSLAERARRDPFTSTARARRGWEGRWAM
jgi:hypothetical protein